MKQALQIAIDYMNDRLEDHDCKYQRHPATEAERINILADIETVKEALAKQEHFDLNEDLKAWQKDGSPIPAKQEQGEPVMVNMWPPATQRDRWMYEQGRLAERDPRTHKNIAWELAEKVRCDLDRQSCPGFYMNLAMESIVKHYTTPQQRKPLTEWQPIETAPKDSTSVLIYCPKSERKPVCEAWWAIAFEGSHQGHWQTPIGPNGRGYTILETSPTHWMPLPPPPIEAAHGIKE